MSKEDLVFWKFIFDLAQLVVTVGIAIYVWILSKHKVNATRITKLEDAHNSELYDIKDRLTKIETTVTHMPDREQIGRLHARIDKLSEGVSAMQGEMKGVSDDTTLILQTLIKKGSE